MGKLRVHHHNAWLQTAFFTTAIALVVWETFRGWRAGATRQLLGLLTLAVAYAAAIWTGAAVTHSLAKSNVLVTLMSSAAAGTIVFVFLSILIKKGVRYFLTEDRKEMSAREHGVGALIGTGVGLLFVWIAAIGIRLLGTVAENVMEQRTLAAARMESNAAKAALQPAGVAARSAVLSEESEPPGGLISGLSNLKGALEHGALGVVMNHVDPISNQTYAVLSKITRIIADPQLVQRFTTYPGAKALMDHPKMLALRDDPVIQRTVLSRNYFALLTNEHVTEAVNDPELGRLVRNFDLMKALDFALEAEERN